MPDRGGAQILGLMLLFGFTIAAASSLFIAGTVILDTTQQNAETSGAERSMVDTAVTVDALVNGEQTTGEFSFANAGRGTPEVRADSGYVNITHLEGGDETKLLNSTVGAFEYEIDGTTYAYQAGGVWRRDGDSDASLVRSPNIHYNRHTLTYSAINITGDVTAGSQGGQIFPGSSTRRYPGPTDTNPVKNGSVQITVHEPAYCTAWQQFFRQETSGDLEDRCDGDGTMTVEFTVPLALANLDHGIYTGNFDGHPSDDIDSSEVEESSYTAQTADNIVAQKRSNCAGSYEKLSGTISSGGLHCTWELNNSLTFDTTAAGGEIEIYAKNGIDVDSTDTIKPTGSDNVTLFLDDDLKMRGSSQVGNASNHSQTRVFVSSNGTVTTNGNIKFYGLLYAPDSSVTLQGTGGETDFHGALVGGEVEAQNANVDVNYDPTFGDLTLNYNLNDRPFYYLHVVERKIRLEG
jgi:hypothetical protein